MSAVGYVVSDSKFCYSLVVSRWCDAVTDLLLRCATVAVTVAVAVDVAACAIASMFAGR